MSYPTTLLVDDPEAICRIPLANSGLFTTIDQDDYELVKTRNWSRVNRIGNTDYAVASVNGRNVRLHRLLLGLTDPRIDVDHRDGDGLNNRRKNIRVATRSQNLMNRRKVMTYRGRPVTSQYRGVFWHAGNKSWFASVTVNGKRIGLGYYRNEVDAARAYDGGAVQHYGEFARLNFPPTEMSA